jgi:single-stranded-DNA-specific exonuclease
VIGIVASRLVERFHRPVVLIAGTEGAWKGSGRSIAAFDLHAALAACAEHLERFGGHGAAAGLEIRAERIDDFAAAFAAHAGTALAEDELTPVTPVDALVRGPELSLELCEELRRLGPFGLGNPNVTLLAVGCELTELTPVGDGKHARFRVRLDGRVAGTAIAFGLGAGIDRLRRVGYYDIAFRLEENRWNGTVSPQLVVKRVFEGSDDYVARREWLKREWRKPHAERDAAAAAIFDELGLTEGGAKRHLLESETFRGLLGQEPLAEAA